MDNEDSPEIHGIPAGEQHAAGATAVSLFNQDATGNDFPVLKAFQQYLEAEQAKARKRMFNLAVFFVIVLVVVVVAFSLIMATVINRDKNDLAAVTQRNQTLSDRLLDIVLRDRTQQQPAQQPLVTVQAPQAVPVQPQDASLKPILEQLNRLQKALDERSASPAATVQPTVPDALQQPLVAPTMTAPAQRPSAEALELQRMRNELKRQQEALRLEQEKLKADKEKARLEQVEQHRRRLYPEYYAREDARRAAEEAAKRAPAPLPQQALPQQQPQQQTPQQPVARPLPQLEPAPVAAPIAPKPQPKPVAAPAPKIVPAPQQPVVAPKVAPKTESVPPEPAKSQLKVVKEKVVEPAPRPETSSVPVQNPTVAAKAPTAPSVPKTPPSSPSVQKEDTEPQVSTINIGAGNGTAIPWLIELPENDNKAAK